MVRQARNLEKLGLENPRGYSNAGDIPGDFGDIGDFPGIFYHRGDPFQLEKKLFQKSKIFT
jgi:hypothetical protein